MTDLPSFHTPAEAYQAYMVPTMFEPWSHEMLNRIALSPGEKVLDVACGTGVVSRGAAARVGSEGAVTGIDISPAMLDVARTVQSPEGATIEWVQGRAEELPFPDNTFDVVLCQQGLQFFTDRPAGLREMRRVLKLGGRATVSVWRSPEHQSVKGAMLLALQGRFGPGALKPYSLGDADMLRGLFVDTGFSAVRLETVQRMMTVDSIDEFIAMTIMGAAAAVPALAQATHEERLSAIRSIRQEIAADIAAVQDGEGMVYPMEAHIVIAGA